MLKRIILGLAVAGTTAIAIAGSVSPAQAVWSWGVGLGSPAYWAYGWSRPYYMYPQYGYYSYATPRYGYSYAAPRAGYYSGYSAYSTAAPLFGTSPAVNHTAYCQNRYISYNAATDSFLGYDGYYHRCISP